jgi:5-methylcytosine-specific restriction protein A
VPPLRTSLCATHSRNLRAAYTASLRQAQEPADAETAKALMPTWHDKQRGSSTQRGYGSRWQRARASYLMAHPLCVMCQRDGHLTPAVVVDHIKAHKGDPGLMWNPANWQALCSSHHSRDKQLEERGRPVQKVGPDGWPLP